MKRRLFAPLLVILLAFGAAAACDNGDGDDEEDRTTPATAVTPEDSRENGEDGGTSFSEDDPFGTAVNLAARICSQAEAGQILAPIVVRELAAGKQFMFADLGETELRGFEDPVRLYELRWQEP